jgi:hypothetical protein
MDTNEPLHEPRHEESEPLHEAWLSLNDPATALGISPRAVQLRAERGKLARDRHNGRVVCRVTIPTSRHSKALACWCNCWRATNDDPPQTLAPDAPNGDDRGEFSNTSLPSSNNNVETHVYQCLRLFVSKPPPDQAILKASTLSKDRSNTLGLHMQQRCTGPQLLSAYFHTVAL